MVIREFTDFLLERNDAITNAAYQLAVELVCAHNVVEWDMSVISDIISSVEKILISNEYDVCYPYYGDDETPCPNVGDCCNPNCQFKY